MNDMYAMRRANGDWFTIDTGGRLHVPVFRSRGVAVKSHWRNSGMMLFKPTALDEQALKDLAPAPEVPGFGFWLVDDPAVDPRRGQPLNHAQLTLLIHEPSELQPAPRIGPIASGLSTFPQDDSSTIETWEGEGGGYPKGIQARLIDAAATGENRLAGVRTSV